MGFWTLGLQLFAFCFLGGGDKWFWLLFGWYYLFSHVAMRVSRMWMRSRYIQVCIWLWTGSDEEEPGKWKHLQCFGLIITFLNVEQINSGYLALGIYRGFTRTHASLESSGAGNEVYKLGTRYA